MPSKSKLLKRENQIRPSIKQRICGLNRQKERKKIGKKQAK